MAEEKSALAKAIEAQNALAEGKPPRPGPPAVTVRVLQDCTLNGPNHKALGWRKAGEIVDVAAGPYADSLIAAGLVEAVEATAAPEPQSPAVPRRSAVATATPKPKSRRH